MRWIPEARALWKNVVATTGPRLKGVRGPAIRLMVALGLMAPAALMMAAERNDARRAAAEAAEMQMDAANASWTRHMLERERVYVTAGYAQQFGVPFDLARSIYDAAVEEEIEPQVAFGLVRAESSFRTRAISPVGAVGLTQLLPSTARWISPGTTRNQLYDIDTNLRVGFKYLRYLYEKYDGDEMLALTAYNRGPGTVDRHLRQGRDPNNGYVEKVLTGSSRRHTQLMNARFGGRGRS
jgi:soluble lytic murein transglycosylase-like protein